MKNDGWAYNKAHNAANKKEDQARKDPSVTDKILEEEYRKLK